MDKKLRKKIISEYNKGKGSTKLEKELGISKPTILKVLKEEGITRKRDRCSKVDIKFDGSFYFIERTCKNCKNLIKTKSKDRTICCRNHFNKINNKSLCKPCSLQLQIGEGNPFYGKKHTKKSLQKISKSRKGKGVGKNNSMSNPMWRKKSSDNLRKKWGSGDLEHVRKKMSDKLKETRKLGKIKSVITSKKEKEILIFLKSMGIKCSQSHKVDSKICDIYVPSINLIIEYFGDYWHCNPKKYDSEYYNKNKSMLAKEIWDYDKQKIDLIKSYGYNLEVIWESDLKHDNNKIIEILNKYDAKK